MLELLKLTKQVLVLEKENYVFFLNSKCGSSSIRRMAINELGYGNGDNLIYAPSAAAIKGLYYIDNWIMVIREPLERIISLWLDKVERRLYKGFNNLGIHSGSSFKTFIRAVNNVGDLWLQDSHLWPQTILYEDFVDRIKLIRLEDISEEWPSDLPPLKIENRTVDKTIYNPDKHRPAQAETAERLRNPMLTPELKRTVVNLYKKDFEMLGYWD